MKLTDLGLIIVFKVKPYPAVDTVALTTSVPNVKSKGCHRDAQLQLIEDDAGGLGGSFCVTKEGDCKVEKSGKALSDE